MGYNALMHRYENRQAGFHVIGLVLAFAVIAVIATTAYVVITKSKEATSQEVVWAYNEQKQEWYVKQGVAPNCKEPFVFDQSPINPAQITGALLPGSYRGNNYKPHGGLSTSPEFNGDITVALPSDATLVGLTRYYEGEPPVLQYVATFETDCGIAFRFDHLHTLSPELQALANQTPEPKLNDTRTSPDDNPPRTKFRAGQTIATRVGNPEMRNYGFDFGVYDYRTRNKISQDPQWAKIHNQYQALDWYGVCWFNMLPGVSSSDLQAMALAQTDTRRTVKKASDYCSFAPYKTLDINDGQPVDN